MSEPTIPTEPSSNPSVARITAAGPIIGVVVHGRGAVITRRIELEGPLPESAFDLVVEGITPLADPGSVRVLLPDDSRTLVGVNARISVPSRDDGPGPTAELVETLNRRIDRLHERENALKERAARLQATLVTPQGKKALRTDGPLARVEHALAMSAVVSDTIAALDTRLLDLRLELEETTRRRDAAELEDRQTSSNERMGEGHPTRAFDLRIAPGAHALPSLELSYAVPYAAKWWPQYTLRLTESGTRAELAIEALVAQRTGEDWEGVPIGLSTASIIFDATLPKLPALKLGKKQPPEHRGFREPPPGADKLFESYDAFRGRSAPVPPASRVTRAELAVAYDEPLGGFDDDDGYEAEEHTPFPVKEFARSSGAMPPPAAAPAPVMAQMAMAPMAMRKRSMAPDLVGGIAGMVSSAAEMFGGGGGGPGGPPPDAPEESYDPGADWLAFDMLVLGDRDSSHRGALRRRSLPGGLPESELFDAQDSARRMNLTDPAVSRGLFDYRYDSDGSVRVPADGRLHRIDVLQRPARSHLEWRTVPLVDLAVYREAVLNNPFDSPLLAGPVDVFSEGQLVTTTQVQRVDAGGAMRVGLGVDERIRVARNVRMNEESAGLLGGKRELTHDVEIELRSGLGDVATVDVIDRVPVTSDDHVDIAMIGEKPASEAYDQKDLDHPIEGGRRWRIKLEPGGRTKIELHYRVTLRSKDELVGGNRRA